jgi:hypothetical protein
MAQIWVPKSRKQNFSTLLCFFFFVAGREIFHIWSLVLRQEEKQKTTKRPPKNLASAFQKCRNFAVRVRIRSNLERVNILLLGQPRQPQEGIHFTLHSCPIDSFLPFFCLICSAI